LTGFSFSSRLFTLQGALLLSLRLSSGAKGMISFFQKKSTLKKRKRKNLKRSQSLVNTTFPLRKRIIGLVNIPFSKYYIHFEPPNQACYPLAIDPFHKQTLQLKLLS